MVERKLCFKLCFLDRGPLANRTASRDFFKKLCVTAQTASPYACIPAHGLYLANRPSIAFQRSGASTAFRPSRKEDRNGGKKPTVRRIHAGTRSKAGLKRGRTLDSKTGKTSENRLKRRKTSLRTAPDYAYTLDLCTIGAMRI
jgi:hypothetical protein